MRQNFKPYKNLDELVDILIGKGLYIDDKEYAKSVLTTHSYFDLVNGYKHFFVIDGRYQRGITFRFLHSFRLFDIAFQNILFKYSVFVETRFKNVLAMALGEHYGSHQDDYLNKFHYAFGSSAKEKRFDRTMSGIHLELSPKKAKYPTRHYLENYGIVPPWILFKNVSFSSSIDLYSFLNQGMKRQVAFNLLGTFRPRQDFDLALRCLYTVRVFRNAIAHNLGFINKRLTTPMAVSRSQLEKEFIGNLIQDSDDKKIARGDPYSMLLAMVLLLKDNRLIEDLFFEIAGAILKMEDDAINQTYSRITNIPSDIIGRGRCFLDGRKFGPYIAPKW